MAALAVDAKAAVAGGILVVIAMGASGPAQRRLAEQLGTLDVASRLVGDSPMTPTVHIVKARLTHGFTTDALAPDHERDLTGTVSSAVTKMPAKRRKALDPGTLAAW